MSITSYKIPKSAFKITQAADPQSLKNSPKINNSSKNHRKNTSKTRLNMHQTHKILLETMKLSQRYETLNLTDLDGTSSAKTVDPLARKNS